MRSLKAPSNDTRGGGPRLQSRSKAAPRRDRGGEDSGVSRGKSPRPAARCEGSPYAASRAGTQAGGAAARAGTGGEPFCLHTCIPGCKHRQLRQAWDVCMPDCLPDCLLLLTLSPLLLLGTVAATAA
eukprot:364968-Chlamydomonas_euryale.AAC.19